CRVAPVRPAVAAGVGVAPPPPGQWLLGLGDGAHGPYAGDEPRALDDVLVLDLPGDCHAVPGHGSDVIARARVPQHAAPDRAMSQQRPALRPPAAAWPVAPYPAHPAREPVVGR